MCDCCLSRAIDTVWTLTRLSFGGDAEVELTTVAVALEGVSWSDSELYAACVLHTLMGGGGSFSAGQ